MIPDSCIQTGAILSIKRFKMEHIYHVKMLYLELVKCIFSKFYLVNPGCY
jgi:hypothetical protein